MHSFNKPSVILFSVLVILFLVATTSAQLSGGASQLNNSHAVNNRYNAIIPNDPNGNVVFGFQGYEIETMLSTFSVGLSNGASLMSGANPGANPQLQGSQVTFPGFANNINLVYDPQNQKLKETIVLTQAPLLPPPVEYVDFTWRINYDNRLDVYANGQLQTGDFITEGHINFNHDGITRIGFEKPNVRDANGNEINVSYVWDERNWMVFFNRYYVSVRVPKSFLQNAVYPVYVDPTSITGCTVTATTVECHDGTFTGNNLSTALNISIINATISGADGGNGLVDLDSTGGWILIRNGTLNGFASGVGGSGQITIDAAQWIAINDSTLSGYGVQDPGTTGSGVAGGSGSCSINTGANWNMTLSTSTINCRGGDGAFHSNNNLNTCGSGGNAGVSLSANSILVYGTNSLVGTGGDARTNCAGSCGCNGGSGSYSITGKVIGNGTATLSLEGSGTNGGIGSGGGSANGGNGNGVLSCSLITNVTLSASSNGGGRGGGGTPGGSTFTSSALNGTHIFNPSSSITSTTQDGTVNTTWNYKAKEITAINTTFSLSGSVGGNIFNFTDEPARFGLFQTGNVSISPADTINWTLDADSKGYLIGGQNIDPQLNNKTTVQYRPSLTQYFAPYLRNENPANGALSMISNVVFNCSAEAYEPTGRTLSNISIWISNGGWHRNQTVARTGLYNTSNFTIALPEGQAFSWSCSSADTTGAEAFGLNYTLTTDAVEPIVNITAPQTLINYHVSGTNLTLNWTASDENLQACWFQYNNVNTTVTCSANTTSFNVTNYNARTLTFFANDSAGNVGNASRSWEYNVFEHSRTFSASTLEQSTDNFIINVSWSNTTYADISAELNYNGSEYTTTETGSGSNSVFTRALAVPEVSTQQNYTFFWEFTLANSTSNPVVNSFSSNQTVNPLTINNCSTGGVLVYNFTLRDEDTQNFINATAFNSSIQVDLKISPYGGDVNPFVNFSATYDQINPAQVCISANITNASYRTDLVASYVTSQHVTEFYYIDNGTLTGSSIPENINLYDLLLSESTTFLFTFLDQDGLEVPNTIVHTLRYYIGQGQFLEVERSKEDNNGETHIHLIEEDVIYKFRVTLNSRELFLSDQYNAKCLSSPCSVTLSAQPEEEPFTTVYNNLPQGSYRVEADRDTRVVTLYFNLNESAIMNLTVFTSNNNIEQAVASSRLNASAGQVSVTVPSQYGNATYAAVVYFNSEFVATRIVDLSESANDYFGQLGLFLASLAILCLALIGASHGEWVIVWTVVGLLTTSLLWLIDLPWYALMTFIAGAGVLLVKLIQRRGG